MAGWPRVVLLATIATAACGLRTDSQTLTPERAKATEESVRAFARTVAHDVTQEGPAAWRRFFADSPAFFMASEGHLEFPNSISAAKGIQDLTKAIKKIELRWGDDLRVDPLTPDLAVLAATFHEVLLTAEGGRIEETGFFTGVTEHREGRWQFRNAHWSVPVP